MSKRLTLQDLVDLLSENKGLTKKDAEAFLRELFNVISENIELKDSVRIKDFGTFKLVKVNSRKSVDVNTGKDIEIPAHYKLGFTPDKSLRDKINAPFAHFETILLKDGVDLEDTEEVLESLETEVADVESADIAEISEEKEPEVVEHIKEVKLEEAVPVKEAEIQDAILDVVEEIKEVISDTKKEDELVESAMVVTFEAVTEQSTEGSEDVEEHEEKSNKVLWLVIGVLIIVLLGGLFYFRNNIFDSGDKPVLAESIPSLPIKDSLDESTVAENDSVVLKGETLLSDIEEEGVGQRLVPLDTIEIKYGDTMRNLGLKYYGNKSFWVYIYEENRVNIKNFNNVPLGTRLVIPAAEKYGIDAKSKESVSAARKLEGQYLAN